MYLEPVQLSTEISWPLVLSVFVGGISAFVANLISFEMIAKINERVSEKEQISYLWWGTEVRRRFKELYPTSRLVLLLDSCYFLMALGFIVLVKYWVLG